MYNGYEKVVAAVLKVVEAVLKSSCGNSNKYCSCDSSKN